MAIYDVTSGQTLVESGGVYYESGISVGTAAVGDVISVTNGGTVEDIIVTGSGTRLVLSSGGTAISTTIAASGILLAVPFSIETSTVVNAGGILDLLTSNSSATNPIVVTSGGNIEFATLSYLTAGFGDAYTETANTSGALLTVSQGGKTQSVQLAADYPITLADGPLGKLMAQVCYAGGTQILTAGGERPIEAIHEGDTVVVRRNGQDVLEPVTFVGKSKIDLARHAHPERAAPIRIKAGALAENTPVRDLVVSPEHCLILNGRCVPAKLLVNGGSIAREYRTEQFEYDHLELARHGILIADGAEAESYLDTGNRSTFDNAGVPHMLHPAFEVNAASDRWKTDACAPLASLEHEVAPIWQDLADRSAAIGFAVSTPSMVEGPDLHILADGQRIQPISDHDSRYVFTVPAGVKAVSLGSRFCIPADKMVSSQRDTRRLGVSVNWIAIRAGDNETILSADHPALRDGWNDAEQVGAAMWRWTDGAATIPWENINGSAVLTIRCVPVDQYPVYDEKLALVA